MSTCDTILLWQTIGVWMGAMVATPQTIAGGQRAALEYFGAIQSDLNGRH
jgi:hypothetical protein